MTNINKNQQTDKVTCPNDVFSWTCGVGDHTHLNEEAAMNCIKLREKKQKSLRDEFALSILQTLITDEDYSNMRDKVEDAYHYADIMLEVRENEKQRTD